jgi:uncharacterized protein YneF (UPF0154 family)
VITDLLVFILIVGVAAVVGVAVGILLAPRIERLTDKHDEEPGDGDD